MSRPAPRIALLDSGVDPDHHALRSGLTLEPGPVLAGADGRDRLGHGTAVATAILELCPAVTLCAIKVFDRQPRCDPAAVLEGLEAALAWRPDLINVSLGIADPGWRDRFGELVVRARTAGVRVVSPGTISGLPSLPGSLPEACGVIDDPNVARHFPTEREVGGRRWWFASPFPRGARQPHRSGVSLATAYVTGHLARLL